MRLGLFGGAFDPVHNAHLFIADAVRDKERLDRIIFLPVGAGHHRSPPRATVEHRAAMLRLAIASNPDFALDLIDTDESSTGYTADLAPRLRAKYPEDELYFIVGSDSLVRSRWRRFEEVLAALDGFLVAPRDDMSGADVDRALADLEPRLRERVRYVDVPRVAESATLVRERLEAGESVRYLVPDGVWRYMAENNLYLRDRMVTRAR